MIRLAHEVLARLIVLDRDRDVYYSEEGTHCVRVVVRPGCDLNMLPVLREALSADDLWTRYITLAGTPTDRTWAMGVETHRQCPDCRCALAKANHDSLGNDSRYCDHCLLERVRGGEKVPGGAYTDDHGRLRHMFHAVCSRCDGTGLYVVSATQIGSRCFRCWGNGWITEDHEGVRQTSRWWVTYQRNRRAGARR